MNIFEQASRVKLRFNTPKGQLTVEDLWSLPLKSERTSDVTLNSIAVDIHNTIEAAPTVIDFVDGTKEEAASDNSLRFSVVTHVIKVLVAERNARDAAAVDQAVKDAKRKKIIAALGAKDDADLANSSKEDLIKMLNDM